MLIPEGGLLLPRAGRCTLSRLHGLRRRSAGAPNHLLASPAAAAADCRDAFYSCDTTRATGYSGTATFVRTSLALPFAAWEGFTGHAPPHGNGNGGGGGAGGESVPAHGWDPRAGWGRGRAGAAAPLGQQASL